MLKLNTGKDTWIYIAPYRKHLTLKALRYGMYHTVLPANSIPAYHLRQRSPDGAITDCSGRHLVVAYRICFLCL